MAHARDPAMATSSEDEVKPYKIRVASRYLELTKRKLELTRLPHQIPEPRSNRWWEPQPTVEDLVDFWLESFSWREQEQEFNTQVPQFRTAIKTSALNTAVRLHFVHAPSRHAHAIPLLLIPPFPFTNLSVAHLVGLFVEPFELPFHLVIPSLPGLGFSDALPDKMPAIPTIAHMLNVLMGRLGYEHFLVTDSGSSPSVLAPVDWKVANHLALHYPDSCLGVHFVSPPLRPPRMRDSPIMWAKWKVASVLRSPILGYSRDDLEALRVCDNLVPRGATTAHALLGFGSGGAHEPNTMAYALCDSPLGLLLFFLMIVRMSGPNRTLPLAEMIKMTELTWLPGPEGTIRLWAQCVSGEETQDGRRGQRPRTAITVFSGDQGHARGNMPLPTHSLPEPIPYSYACPAWADRQYRVVACNRVAGRPGLLAWERPQIIAAGVRGLAKSLLAVDGRLAAPDAARETLPRQAAVECGKAVGTTAQTTIAVLGEAPRNLASASEPAGKQAAGPSSEREARGQPTRDVSCRRIGEADESEYQRSGGSGGIAESRGGSPDTVIAVQLGP